MIQENMDTLREALQAVGRTVNRLQSAAGAAARTQDFERFTPSTRDELLADRRSRVSLSDLDAANAVVKAVFDATTPVVLEGGAVIPAPTR